MLLILATFTLLFGLDRGSNVSWIHTYTLISLSLFPLLLCLLISTQKNTEYPLIPLHLISQPLLLATDVCTLFTLAAQTGMLFYVPLYLQAVANISATELGMVLVPLMLCSVTGGLFGGKMAQRTGRYYWLNICSSWVGMMGAGAVVACSGVLSSSAWGVVFGMGVLGFGCGCCEFFHFLLHRNFRPISTGLVRIPWTCGIFKMA